MNIAEAIMHIHPGASPLADFNVVDDGTGQRLAMWNIDAPEPTEAELKNAWTAVMSQRYKQYRAAEYPSIGDQLDALWRGGEAAEKMLLAVNAVKEKYPKD